jgi:patatin-like phospholipase/acyl hydrolase
MKYKTPFLFSMLLASSAFAQTDAKTLRFISLDAGALLEFVPILLLEKIEEHSGKPISTLVDGFMGASSGAIVAALASTPNKLDNKPKYSMTAIKESFEANAIKAFSPKALLNAVFTWLKWPGWTDYEGAGRNLESLLVKQYGQTHLSQVTTDLMIATYDTVLMQPRVFNSTKAKQDPDHNLPLWQAVRASTAVPFMFGPAQARFHTAKAWTNLMDPGMKHFSNPSALLCQELANSYPRDQKIVIYSLGTGLNGRKDKNRTYFCTQNIEVVRIDPDYSDRDQSWVRRLLSYKAGSNAKGYFWDINYLAAIPLTSYINYIKEHAEPLYKTSQYQRMLADLTSG